MPAVDPQRLERQCAELKVRAEDPIQLAQYVKGLLEQYADRTRSGTRSRSAIPQPVLRTLRLSLQDSVTSGRVDSAEALWKLNSAAAKLLAISLLEKSSGTEVAGIAERWARQRVRSPIVQELGERGLLGWRREAEAAFLEQVKTWLGSERSRDRVLALFALRGAAIDPSFEALPDIFRILQGRLAGMRGEYREAVSVLVGALARVAPGETSHFLSQEVESSPREVKTLASKLSISLPDLKSTRVV